MLSHHLLQLFLLILLNVQNNEDMLLYILSVYGKFELETS